MIEDRLEAVERQLIRLNKTLQELISLYLDTQLNPLLGDLPKNSKFVPTIIDDRNKRRANKDKAHFTLLDIRSIVEQSLKVFDIPTLEHHLHAHEATCVADLPEQHYYSFAQTLLNELEEANKT